MAHPDTPRSTSAPRPPGPRRARWAVLGLAFAVLIGSSGCMVMDELDSASAKMPTNSKYKKEKEAGKRDSSGESLGAAGRLAAAKSATLARSKQWWSEARTMTPGEKPAGIVSCRLPEGIQFMTVDDCVTQGGRPSDGGS